MPPEVTGDRGVAIGGDVRESTIITGDGNAITIVEAKPREPARLTRETWRPWLREHTTPARLIAVVVALVGLVSGVIAIYQFVAPLTTPAPVMTHSLNVAIAELGVFDSQHRALDVPNFSLGNDLYTVLDAELKQPFAGKLPPNVEVWDPKKTGRIRGQTPEQRAREINADLLVYGEVTTGPTGTTLKPQFYFAARKLQDAEELTGVHDFGGDIRANGDLRGNSFTATDLGNQLLPRIRALSQFVLGLDQFQLSHYDLAGQYFDAARREGWPDGEGKEVLYLFLGNAAGRRNDLDSAENYYQQALNQRAGYPRAQMGLAEVRFQRSGASVDCEPDRVQLADLRAAIAQFRTVADAPPTPGLSNIRTKANLALGHGYACLSLAQDAEDHWADADTAFKTVIADYDSRNAESREAVRDLAAEAHAGVGLGLLPSTGDPPGPTRDNAYRAAASEYQQAIDLTAKNERRAVFYRFLGHIHTRLNDFDAADTDYAQAATHDPANRTAYEELRRQLRAQRTPG